ncbi:dienelactone hydrolase family protein [Nitrosopumilus sp. K4]|uniref:dienelactone hydrolase family protein n=1 Tax=Nitrosopumilus sp. K4 TaxID=2795383 RepID=UPI001BA9A3F4|nr:dienelactone hydrolase family protein [Nitrosopumilus sp. K4]QUC63913.1 dienelactone hydrolase family protein [Nitrosopumilus sp. K4]
MKLLSFFILFLVFSIGIVSYAEAQTIAYFPPPLKQIKAGQDPANVTCTEGKELVLKQTTGMPACVNFSSVEKLIQRGWAIHVLPDYSLGNNNSKIFKTGKFETISENVNYFQSTNGYLAKPSSDGDFPGVIMIHEWWGLNQNIKDMADKLASHGYVVLAVDLYNGKVGTTSEEARRLVSSFDKQQGIQNMNAAVSYVEENFSINRIGSIGWCFGGGQSLILALNNNSMDATVIYYGSVTSDVESLSVISWPVLGIFAELDRGITPDNVNEFKSTLDELSIQNEIHIYPGVDHAFANPSGERFAPDASQDAWQKTLRFLKENL